MSEWVDSTVGAVTLYQRAGGTPTATTDSFYGGDIPFVTIEDITNGTRFLDRTEKNLSEAGLANSAAWLIKEPHVLYSMYATVGKPIINRIACATNQAIIALKESSEIEQSFLLYQLLFIRPTVYKYTAQTTQSNLNAGSVKKLPISYPKDKREQRKIATILSGIDTAIEKTEALIAKYQQIKAGLMHDLFTRGVLPNGQLRPPREQAPELYQQTAIGWVPREWDVKPCADLCSRICVGIVIQPTQYYVEDGVPAFRSANVREDGIDPNNFVYISAGANRLLAKSQVKTGDIVSVRTGYPGTSAVIPSEFQGANCIDILISTPNEKVISEFLCDWINSSFGKGQVLRQQGGMAQQHFNVGEMRELLVALPDLNEQERIRGKIKSVSGKLAIEKALAEKLQAQKSGLMHDLLTGKVTVKVEEPEVVDG